MNQRTATLRLLIANDRRRIELYSAIMADLTAAELDASWLNRCRAAHAILEGHERALALLELPRAKCQRPSPASIEPATALHQS